MPQPTPNFLELALPLLSPFLLPMLAFAFRHRKVALRLLQIVADVTRKQRADRADEDEEAAIQNSSMSGDYKAYVGSIDKRVDVMQMAVQRIDSGFTRIEDAVSVEKREMRQLIFDVSENLRRRLDGQIINQSSIDRSQNTRLNDHETKIAELDGRLRQAEERVMEDAREITNLRADINLLMEGQS